jgi:hypothetical protein
MTGTHGMPGVLKGRGVSGSILRSTRTPMQTIANASKVPILTSWLSTEIGNNPEAIATTIPVIAVVTCGVRYRGWSLAKSGGSKPSRLIE